MLTDSPHTTCAYHEKSVFDKVGTTSAAVAVCGAVPVAAMVPVVPSATAKIFRNAW